MRVVPLPPLPLKWVLKTSSGIIFQKSLKSDQSCKNDLIIGIDTSGAFVRVAILQGKELLIQKDEPKQTGVERLFPLIHEMFQAKNLSWDRMNAIGVCVGPGNFNGIRIGVSAARGLSLSLGIPAIGVTKFDAFALGHSDPLLVTVKSVKDKIFGRIGLTGQPFVSEINSLRLPTIENLAVVGFEAERISGQIGINSLKTKYNSAQAVAIISSNLAGEDNPPPHTKHTCLLYTSPSPRDS